MRSDNEQTGDGGGACRVMDFQMREEEIDRNHRKNRGYANLSGWGD